ncbi:GH39 family glycosyl hydrolase [Alienimonas chondri]|uniref:Glycosyl hydrolases family 39 N-terminal catalytic domain-containing protein n=1 Tax=Alienimonas chondri TaxID=2681879 RepID=A0ABX1VLN4_9PLAN|nr:hypothetical protein [Alienimonas chondri]NNJ27902.1 hypothetical protein [Alienimonas chondri]
MSRRWSLSTFVAVLLVSSAASGRAAPPAGASAFEQGASDQEATDRAATGWGVFGIGSCYINNRSTNDLRRWVPQMAAIDLRVHRTPYTNWGAVEPERGVWNWDVLNDEIQYLEERGFEFGALLVGNPKWNEADPPGHLPVNNLEGWSNYVTQLATHLKGKVRRYEVWNEPPNFTGKDQTPADYAEIVVAAYHAAKAVDPDCQVGLAAKSAHINYLEQTVLAGAKDHFDYIVLHPYEILDGVAENTGSEAVYLNVVPSVRKMLAARNPAKADVPILFTELGVDAERTGEDVQAHALVKAYVMGIAQGVECIQWFEGRDGDSGPMGLLDRNGVARPAYTALGTLIERLGQRPAPIGWTLLNDRHHAFLLQGAEGPALVVWGDPGSPDRIDFQSDVRVVDPRTGHVTVQTSLSLGEAPVIVLDPPAALVARAAANCDRPVPWGGNDAGTPEDYAEADRISIEFGETTTEKGLHTRSGAHVAESVVAYGGSARSGRVPGGNVFVVDPNFLSYESASIEITAVVRRTPSKENAGFKLVYESPGGFKTAGGWYTIPKEDRWHTKTWRIDDPQFVNYWGYNFILESDGNAYNNYFIRSVTVRRLDRPAR